MFVNYLIWLVQPDYFFDRCTMLSVSKRRVLGYLD